VLLAGATWLLLSLLLVPDPGGKLLFARAQSLEARGLVQPALRQYLLLAEAHATSPHAAQALLRAGDLMVDLARAGDTPQFTEAVATYDKLATTYPQHLLAGTALLRAAEILIVDLRSPGKAREMYNRVLEEYPNNREYAAEAMLRLGRVAQDERDGKTAQSWYQRVLQRYPTETQRSAEAQFRLGETYETLLTSKDHKVWARNAYDATIKNYPSSVWAGKAKERLGLMVWVDIAPRERRVQLETKPLPDEGTEAGTLLGAIRMVLAARGVLVNDTVLRGWGMEPFFAGYSQRNQSLVVAPPFEAWENVAANTGLVYQLRNGKDAKDAVKLLQYELDDAHTTLIYTGKWRLVAGYDSARNEVQLQSRGARYDIVTAADLVTQWKQRSPLGSPFGLLAFHTPGEVARLKATPVTTDRAEQTASPTPTAVRGNGTNRSRVQAASTPEPLEPRLSPLAAPTFVYKLDALNERNTHRRAIRHASIWMKRPRDEDGNLLNLAALHALAGAMKRMAAAEPRPKKTDEPLPPPSGELPVRAQDAAVADGAVTGEVPAPPTDEAAAPASPVAGVPTPVAPPAVAPVIPDPTPRAPTKGVDKVQRARALLGWRGAPLLRWVTARRQAAAYLDVAAARLNQPSLRRAADEFRNAITALENAAMALPLESALGKDGVLNENARRAFETAAREIERARSAETRATDLMSSVQ
jgi:TolA-binding protein